MLFYLHRVQQMLFFLYLAFMRSGIVMASALKSSVSLDSFSKTSDFRYRKSN